MARKALGLLAGHDWPGNFRELINVIENAFVLCSGDEIKPDHLPANLTGSPRSLSSKQPNSRLQVSSDDRKGLLEALKRTGGNKSEAARLLGISRVTLWKRLKKYDIEVDKEIRG